MGSIQRFEENRRNRRTPSCDAKAWELRQRDYRRPVLERSEQLDFEKFDVERVETEFAAKTL